MRFVSTKQFLTKKWQKEATKQYSETYCLRCNEWTKKCNAYCRKLIVRRKKTNKKLYSRAV